MNESAAVNLVKKTFENPYSRERFLTFAKDLFHFLDTKTFVYRGKYIPDAYKTHVKTLERIGKYEDQDNNKIDILAVQLKKQSSLEHARTMQRNFIAWYLNGSRGNVAKDAALVAFYAKDSDDWRLSLVKMDYHLAKSQSGKLKAVTELTPARRFSFLVGKDENTHTAQRQLLLALQKDEHPPKLADLENAFSVEVVTKDFFEKYKKLFLDTKEALDKIIIKNSKIKADFQKKNIDPVDFAKKLLGQIVFLYFLQKKGWFGVRRGKDWGTGSKTFLRDLFNDKIISYKNFFNDALEPLFYDALARDRSDVDYFNPQFNCKIPFLNGGLFDPLGEYDWVDTDINLPNSLFSNKKSESDEGSGILDIFDLYNFTVKEDEPLDKEVAVDPEMLGKVFENLLEVKDRKSKGTYYTPREIVHYMCQESLINHLMTESGLSKGKIESLVKPKVLTKKDYQKFVRKKGNKKYVVEGATLVLWEKEAKDLDKVLENIRVCDPACGSGAFLVGMLQEIINARKRLAFILDKKISDYDFKREAIQNSLYGVDIDLGAVEIAKLRLWLSLIVDEQDIKQIKPLPNLDYKIMQGNSLVEFISPGWLQKYLDKDGQKLIDMFNHAKEEYLQIYSFSEKKKKRQEINDLITKIINYEREIKKETIWKKLLGFKGQQKLFKDSTSQLSLGESEGKKKKIVKLENQHGELKKLKAATPADHFEWHLNFNEVFEKNKGFDVVIANPPYVSVKQISRDDKKRYSEIFDVGKGRFNLFTLFLEKGLALNKNKGILIYIIPEGIYSHMEYRHVRNYIINNSQILLSVLFTRRVFEASVDATVLGLQKNLHPGGTHKFPVIIDLSERKNLISSKLINNLPYNLIPIQLSSQDLKIIVKLINNSKTTIKDAAEIQQGIIYSGQPKDKVFSDSQKDRRYKRILDGRDILKWIINWENKNYDKYLLYTDELHRPREERLFLAREKLLLPRKSKSIFAAYDNEQYYCLNTAYVVLNKNKRYASKFLLAVLNSHLINYYYSKLFLGWQVTIPALEMIPLPSIKNSQQKYVINLVDKILAITKDDNYLENLTKQAKVHEYERQIDQLVYKLYGLTPEEIEIVEGNTK